MLSAVPSTGTGRFGRTKDYGEADNRVYALTVGGVVFRRWRDSSDISAAFGANFWNNGNVENVTEKAQHQSCMFTVIVARVRGHLP